MEEDRVTEEWRCPKCQEDRVDALVWVDDTYVRCSTCGVIYAPDEQEQEEK